MNFRFSVLYFLVFVLFVDCEKKSPPEKEIISNKYHEIITNHPSKEPGLYNISLPWEKRIYPLDKVHGDYALKMNQIDGYTNTPIPYKKMEDIKKRLKKIAGGEPENIKKLKNNLIYGIYLCSGLGSTGLAGFVRTNDNSPGGFIILDGEKINKKANEWISQKESSVFQESKKSKISIRITNKKNNTVENTLEYIILHELGHIVAQTCKVLPDQGAKNRDFSQFEFSKEDWLDEETSKHDKKFPLRKFLQFYDEDSDYFIANDGVKIYTQLGETPFPTLYSSQNPDEHFAESFVSYVHLFLYRNPWELELTSPQKTFIMKNGLSEPRSKRKNPWWKLS